MARQSAQHKLDRVRPPRVQITYDVEVGGAIEIKELPFVVGVIGRFHRQPGTTAAEAEGSQIRRSKSGQFRHGAGGDEAAPFLRRRKQAERRSECSAIEGRPEVSKVWTTSSPGNVAKQVKPLKEVAGSAEQIGEPSQIPAGQRQAGGIAAGSGGRNTEKLEKLKGEIGVNEGGSNG